MPAEVVFFCHRDIGFVFHYEVYPPRFKGAENCDWMMSRFGLCREIISEELSMLSILETVSNIVGVWPLIVVYLKEAGKGLTATA